MGVDRLRRAGGTFWNVIGVLGWRKSLNKWWPETGSNRRRRPFQGRALPLSYLALACLADPGSPSFWPRQVRLSHSLFTEGSLRGGSFAVPQPFGRAVTGSNAAPVYQPHASAPN